MFKGHYILRLDYLSNMYPQISYYTTKINSNFILFSSESCYFTTKTFDFAKTLLLTKTFASSVYNIFNKNGPPLKFSCSNDNPIRET